MGKLLKGLLNKAGVMPPGKKKMPNKKGGKPMKGY